MNNDKLKKLFQEKLYNHETPVHPTDWEIISERLLRKRKRKFIPLFYVYYTVGVAAALLIVLFLLQPKSNDANYEITAQKHVESIEKIADIVDNSTAVDNHQAVLEEDMDEKNINSIKNNNFYATANVNKKSDIDFEQKNKSVTDEKYEEIAVKIYENLQQNTLAENTEKPLETQENESAESQETKISTPQTIDNEWWNMPDDETNKTKRNSSWSLAFASGQSIGSSQTASYFTNNIWTKRFESGSLKISDSYNFITIGQFAEQNYLSSTPYAILDKIKDMKHNRPISFGVRVKKNISNRINLKTGLSYSYFLSELDESDVKIQQNIHYLGIPVGVEFLLLKKNRLNLYVSSEFSVEKGIAYYLNSLGKTIIGTIDVFEYRGSVRGLQFSANTGLGISYNFIKTFGLYAETNAIYYIKDNRQYQSFRTEKPFNFGFIIGLKFDF